MQQLKVDEQALDFQRHRFSLYPFISLVREETEACRAIAP